MLRSELLEDNRRIIMPSKLLNELYRSAQLGVPGALNQLLAELRPRLHAVGTRIVPPGLQAKIDASDVVQNTLKDAFQGFNSFRGATVDEFWSWICAIHRNNAKSMVTHFRTQRRDFTAEVPLQECLPIQTATVQPHEATEAEKREILRRAFQRLSLEDQAILNMKVVQAMDYRQISEVLGENEATLRKRYSRAMIRWNKKLEEMRETGMNEVRAW